MNQAPGILSKFQFKLPTISLLLLSFLILNACSKDSSSSEPTTVNDNSPQSITPAQGMAIATATAEQCAAGGIVYAIFLDSNGDGQQNSGEPTLSSQVVCNGQNGDKGAAGKDGLSTLFSLNRVNVDLSSCASGAGLQVNAGLDSNRSGQLEPSEITQAQVICDGQTGPRGANGHGLAIQTLAASTDICPAGGSVLVIASDIHSDGVYDPTAPQQQSLTLCNGSNAAVSAYMPIEPILPCGDTVAYKEVLLRLQNGRVLGSFSKDASGKMTRLAFLPDGSFMNTDDSQCTFSLSTSQDGLTRSISWFGKEQMSWPMTY